MNGQPALGILVPYAAGLLIGHLFDPSIATLYIIFGSMIVVAILLFLRQIRYSATGFGFIIYALLAAGVLQYEIASEPNPSTHIVKYSQTGKAAIIDGIIDSYPELRGTRMSFVLDAEKVIFQKSQRTSTGKILVFLGEIISDLQYGDRVRIKGVLKKPSIARNPGEFSYADYLAAQDIFVTVRVRKAADLQFLSSGGGSWLFREMVVPVKSYLSDIIDRLPASESALLKGLLIGDRGEISPEIKNDFAAVGVIHILAVSGLHVGFIVLAVMTIAGVLRIPFKWTVMVTILCLIFYAYLTNLKPSVVRAATMGSLVLLGEAFERKTNFANSIALAGFLILIFRPLELFQPGFQLSFSAVIAIVYLYPKLKASTPFSLCYTDSRLRFMRYPLDLLLVSSAAFFGTLPLTAIYFHRIPLLSLPANLLIVPLSFMALGNALVAALVNLIWTEFANIFLATCQLSLSAIINTVRIGSQIPFAYWEIYSFTPLGAICYTTILYLLFNLDNARIRCRSVLAILIFCNIWVWQDVFESQNQLEIYFMDVGQGDCILIRFPDKRVALIDGGKRNPYFDTGARTIAPFLKSQNIRTIDALILSHADSDHLGGFPYIMRNFKIKEVWDNGVGKNTRLYREYQHLIDSLDIKHRIMHAGTAIYDFKPALIFVVHPSPLFLNQSHNANDASLSLKLSYGTSDFLFLGDIETAGELSANQFGSLLQAEVLKVSHHGSKTSSSPAFLKYASPELAIVSVGENNHFGHPAPEVLQRLQASGARILRTDLNRAIILKTDGEIISQEVW